MRHGDGWGGDGGIEGGVEQEDEVYEIGDGGQVGQKFVVQ